MHSLHYIERHRFDSAVPLQCMFVDAFDQFTLYIKVVKGGSQL